MIDAGLLLTDTKKQVVALIEDIRTGVATDSEAAAHVATEYEGAQVAGRTALSKAEWAEGLYAQVAVAWVLGCVFVRFCEDNELIDDPLLGGPGIRSQIALDHRAAHLQANPAHDDRHWLREVFGRLRALPATGEIFGDHNPVWVNGLQPSADGARKLREELTRRNPETGDLRHDFTDPAWDTRFLGDLYQDLSDQAKKTYALLQTPIFVEEFILERTLEPALATFGLRETTAIDPTCGSGHFLLGIFAHLFERWCDAEPGTNRRELARRALNAIGGVDLNPFAASIARFRLLVAALRAGGDTRLADAPAYLIHIAVGDSLLHSDPPGRLPGTTIHDESAGAAVHGYSTEDVEEARALLSRSWHAVVGNPPYITVKDPALRDLYRSRYHTCSGSYSLGVPFTERFFQLACSDNDAGRAGYVGMITANSFMKRQFGKKLIEQWVPTHDLTHVIDTSGAYIPGHGTPTVILFGRNRSPVASTVRAVMGIRGEPGVPLNPEKGFFWSSIVELVDKPGSSSEFISVVELARERIQMHPWSLGGGGAAELKSLLEDRRAVLRDAIEVITTPFYTRQDDAYFAPAGTWKRFGVPAEQLIAVGIGEDVRDWSLRISTESIFPYDGELQATISAAALHVLWPNKAPLRDRRELGGRQEEIGLTWFEWNRFLRHRFTTPLSIAFAAVATSGHFTLDRGGKAFKQTAPVIQLPAKDGVSSHLRLLGILNSSTATFWLRNTMHDKGNRGEGGGITDEAWERFFDFDGTKLQMLPLPSEFDATTATLLDRLSSEVSTVTPGAIVGIQGPTEARLADAERRFADLRSQMIAAQEGLDWEMYKLYGLTHEDLTTGDALEPPLLLGERAFEIVLARRMVTGEEESSWFARHRSTPITELPTHWPEAYRQLVQRRIELIENDLNIGLIERPEHKRRWASKPWDEQVRVTLRGWLLDRLESPRYWPEPASITSTARLASEVRSDVEFLQVARLYAGHDDIDVATLVSDLVKPEAVPYLAMLRYTDSGLRKHDQWLATWGLQRHEDAGEDVSFIPVPPKYGKSDFTGAGWEHRGKLDVPKERFISYPGAEREIDASTVIGWAGWRHLERARALAAWYLQARRDGRDAAHLTPLLAGLAELLPWLMQWYDEPNPDPALDRPGTQIAALVETEMRSLGLIAQDLTTWRPEKKRSGRAKRATT